MHYEENATYHVFNRSNEKVFLNRENYLFFLEKLRKYILPFADILAYCLMPNHFHLLVNIKSEGAKYLNVKGKEEMQYFPNAMGLITSSYTQAINKKKGRRGSLFSHSLKAKILNNTNADYGINCFMYIHQNPKLANLVDKIEEWEFSSFPDYIGKRKGTLINKELTLDILDLDINDIYSLTYKLLSDKTDEDFL